MTFVELQTTFVRQVVQDISIQWDEIHIHFEYFRYKGKQFESQISNSYFNGVKSHFVPSLEANDILIDMIDAMSKDGSEKWTWCEFTLNSEGIYNFEYKYGMPPLTEQLLKNSGDL